MAAHDGAGFIGYGPKRILAGSVFSLALMLVVIAGGELFIGNALIVVSVLEGKILKRNLFTNCAVVYFSNLIGALLLVALTYYSNTWEQITF